MSVFDAAYQSELQRRRDTDALRMLHPGMPLGPVRLRRGDQELLNFSSNNYLGLTHHPELIARTRLWAEQYGTGSGASRLVSGTFELHEQIEAKLAAFKKTEAALLFASGFQANVSVLPALLDPRIVQGQPLVFADKLIHASLHQGCSAAGVRPIRFRHNDLDHLQALLRKHAHQHATRFVISESVFSMDGDTAPIDDLLKLSHAHGAFLLVDEAHATGTLGPGGAGLTAALDGQVDLVLGTCSKALGCFGAYVGCSRVLRDFLINRCGGVIYSTALPPPVLGAIDAAVDLVPTLEDTRARLAAHGRRVRRALADAGLDTGTSSTHIVPVIIGNDTQTLQISRSLTARGVLGVAIRPPAVPPGTARIRFGLSAAHDHGAIDRLLDAINQSIAEAGVARQPPPRQTP